MQPLVYADHAVWAGEDIGKYESACGLGRPRLLDVLAMVEPHEQLAGSFGEQRGLLADIWGGGLAITDQLLASVLVKCVKMRALAYVAMARGGGKLCSRPLIVV